MQRPDATLVAGFNRWKNQFGRNVMRGEHGIKIIAPTPYKVKKEREKLDPDTNIPVRDADGKIVTEEVEVKIPMYGVATVFDVSQTEGRALPTLAVDLAGDVKQFEIFMEALRRSAPVPIRFEELSPDLDGYFRQPAEGSAEGEKFIAIREGMSEVQTVCAAIHEIGHAKLHDREQARLAAKADPEHPPKPKDKYTREEWEESRQYADRMEAIKPPEADLEAQFLSSPADAFAIYQVKNGEQYHNLRFERMDILKKDGIPVVPENYDLVYTDALNYPGGAYNKLQYLFDLFNTEYPEDYRGRSASASDIIALKQGDKVSYHYVDAWGFVELPHFQEQDNPLKNADGGNAHEARMDD